MLSMGMDLDAVVNDSYGFLSDMDSGTLPRRKPVPVQVQSWNERSDPRLRRNVANREDQQYSSRSSNERNERGRQLLYRQQETEPQEAIGYSNSPSNLWKRVNGNPSNVMNQGWGDPQRQPPQIGSRHLKRVSNHSEQHYSENNLSAKLYPKEIPPQRSTSSLLSKKEKDGHGDWRNISIQEYNEKKQSPSFNMGEEDQRGVLRKEGNRRVAEHHTQWVKSSEELRQKADGLNIRGYSSSSQINKPGLERYDPLNHERRSLYENEHYPARKVFMEYPRDDRSLIYAQPHIQPATERMPGNLKENEGGETIRANSVNGQVNHVPQKTSPGKGSFLLQRTNTYLEAVDSLKTGREHNTVIEEAFEDATRFNGGSFYTEPPQVPDTGNFRELKRVGSTSKVNQRMSAANRLSKEIPDRAPFVPPPPAPPMPPAMPAIRHDTNRHAPPSEETPAWLADLKRGRRQLKRVPSLKRIEIEPEPEPMTFKEKLERIVQKQVAAQRWHEAKPGAKRSEAADNDEPVEVVMSSEPYKTVKTLNKSAMLNKLEKILVKGPPSRPSFHGAFDMDDKRKEAVSRLRTIEKEALEKQRSYEEDDDFDFDDAVDSNVRPSAVVASRRKNKGPIIDEPVVNRQRMLMGGVVATIKLQGAKNSASFS